MAPVKPRSGSIEDAYVSVDAARPLLAIDGRRAARERVFALGLEGRLVMKRIGGRWFVRRDSIEALQTNVS